MRDRIFASVRSAAIRLLPDETKQSLRQRIASQIDKDKLVTYHELSCQENIPSWRFDQHRTCRFDEPEYYNELPDQISNLIGDHEYHQPFVLEVPNVELIGRQGIKRTEDGRYIVFNFDQETNPDAAMDLAYDFIEAVSYGTWPLATPSPVRPRTEIELAVPLLHRWAYNYSHWTEEWLTQFEGLRHYCEQTGKQPTIIIPPSPSSFVYESLATLGYSQDDYIEWNHNRIRVEKLVLPSIRRFRSDTSDDYIRMPSAIHWIRDTILDSIDLPDPADYPSKLFISREDANTRRIINRDEVKKALSKRGFETVVLSDISFVEQKRLFFNADMIVGTHGAGLTELIYAPNAAVVELFGSYMVPVYFEMAKGLGMPYGCLRCEAAGDDIIVDVEELLGAIDSLLARRQSND